VHRFQPATKTKERYLNPSGYRNIETHELGWFYSEGDPFAEMNGFGKASVYEVTFDFQDFLYSVTEVAKPYWEWYGEWERDISIDAMYGYSKGTVDNQLIERLLTDPSFRPTMPPIRNIPWIDFSVAAAMLGIAIVNLLIFRKRRIRHAP